MTRQYLYLLAITSIVMLTLISCEKETLIKTLNSGTNDTLISQGIAKCPIYRFNFKHSLNKSFFMVYSDIESDTMFSTAQEYPYNSTANKYKVMKVYRKSDPTKFFWIMIENFRYKSPNGCYVYNDIESNAKTYGRLYHWEVAKECEKKIRMNIPRKQADGAYTQKTFPTYGHLPTRQDILDLLEVESIGVFPENNSVSVLDLDCDNFYYDVFLSGRDFFDEVNEKAAYHSIAGCRDNTDYNFRDYMEIHNRAFFWLDTEPNPNENPHYHYPFEIDYWGGNIRSIY